MSSFIGTLYTMAKNKVIADIPQTANSIGFRFVDQDFGQLSDDTERPAVSFPCCLIDFATINYEQKQFKHQWAKMDAISFKFGFEPFSNSSNLTPQEYIDKALGYYELEEKFYLSFQDWTADGLLMIPLKRIAVSTIERRDRIRVRQVLFKAVYEDRSLNGEPALGPEQIANGGFAGDATGWTLGAGWSYGDNKVSYNGSHVSGIGKLSQIGFFNDHTRFRTSLNIGGTTGFIVVQLFNGDSKIYPAGAGTVSFDGYWIGSNIHGGNIIEVTPTVNFDGSITNVSVKEIL